MCSNNNIGTFCAFFLILLSIIEAYANAYQSPPKIFNVMSYGAVADGESENSGAFLKAWSDACEYPGRSRVMVPQGTFKIWSTMFVGPCKGPTAFVIKGTLKGPTHPGEFLNQDSWIGFRYVDQLTINGGGYLDGQGPAAWAYNDCSKNPNCPRLPANLRLEFVTNSKIKRLRSIDSKSRHISLFACNNVNISQVRITAPGDSPNTDGIHLAIATKIRVEDTLIQTGDDCIAIITGSRDILVRGVACGPGHGISVGSIGKRKGEFVSGLSVMQCSFNGTQNGVRIKTWGAGSMSGSVSNIFFGNIQMTNVNNPVFIDQNYCPSGSCGQTGSLVQIKDVTFHNIWGSSTSKVAVALECSQTLPCQNLKLEKIQLSYNGPGGGPPFSHCSNAHGVAYGRENPPSCLSS